MYGRLGWATLAPVAAVVSVEQTIQNAQIVVDHYGESVTVFRDTEGLFDWRMGTQALPHNSIVMTLLRPGVTAYVNGKDHFDLTYINADTDETIIQRSHLPTPLHCYIDAWAYVSETEITPTPVYAPTPAERLNDIVTGVKALKGTEEDRKGFADMMKRKGFYK